GGDPRRPADVDREQPARRRADLRDGRRLRRRAAVRRSDAPLRASVRPGRAVVGPPARTDGEDVARAVAGRGSTGAGPGDHRAQPRSDPRRAGAEPEGDPLSAATRSAGDVRSAEVPLAAVSAAGSRPDGRLSRVTAPLKFTHSLLDASWNP